MSKGFVCGKDFYENFEVQKYWSFPSSWSVEKRTFEMNTMIYSDDYMGSEKKDGYFERFIKDEDGNMFLCSRDKGVSGVINKIDWIPHLNPFFASLPVNTVLIGEIYLNGKTSKNIVSILGCKVDKAIERQKQDENKLCFYIFDVLAWAGELVDSYPIKNRVKYLNHIANSYKFDHVEYATYYSTPEDIHENWLRILSEGGEGIVITKKKSPYDYGKRTARNTLKLKKELKENIDVFLTGNYKDATYRYTGSEIETWPYWYNPITNERVFGDPSTRPGAQQLDPVTKLWYNDWAGSVEIGLMSDENKIVPIGWISGISDEVKKGIKENPTLWKGKVAELQAMEIDRSGSIPTIRHGRLMRWRDDKNFKDCSYNQLL